MNWGKNLTLLGAIRLTGWVVLSTMFETTNKDRFVAWLVTKLLPQLTRGDALVLDNLKARHDPRVRCWCKQFGVRLLYLPPYSHDFNPIEPGGAALGLSGQLGSRIRSPLVIGVPFHAIRQNGARRVSYVLELYKVQADLRLPADPHAPPASKAFSQL